MPGTIHYVVDCSFIYLFIFIYLTSIMRLKTGIILGGDNDSQSKEKIICSEKIVF